MPRLALSAIVILGTLCYAVVLQFGTREDINTSIGLFFAAILSLAASFGVHECSSTICKIFFFLAPAQIVLGYFLAFPTTWETAQTPPGYWVYYRQALAIFTLGFVGLTCGFALTPRPTKHRLIDRLVVTQISLLPKYFVLLCLAAVVLASYAYYSTGVVPILTENPLAARYFGSGETNAAMVTLHNSVSIAGVSLPVLVIGILGKQKKPAKLLYIAVLVLTVLVLALGASRAFFLMALMIGAGVLITCYPEKRTAAILTGLLPLGIYLAWQEVTYSEHIDFIRLYGKSLGEVRDFGVLLALFHGRFLYGTSYLAALTPLPLTVSSFRAEHNIIAYTLRVLNLNASTVYGGVRMTIFGEAYLNFGLLGSMCIGALFGAGVKKIDGLLKSVQERFAADPLRAYPVVAIATLFVFGMYEASASAPYNVFVKPAAVLFIIYAIATRKHIVRDPASASASGFSAPIAADFHTPSHGGQHV